MRLGWLAIIGTVACNTNLPPPVPQPSAAAGSAAPTAARPATVPAPPSDPTLNMPLEEGFAPQAAAFAENATSVFSPMAHPEGAVAVFRQQGTAFVGLLDREQFRADWLDVNVTAPVLFAGRVGEIAAAFRQEGRNSNLYVQRFPTDDLRRGWKNWASPAVGSVSGGSLALPCRGTLVSACLQYLPAGEILIAASCRGANDTVEHRYVVYQPEGSVPRARMNWLEDGFRCGEPIDGHSPMAGSVWSGSNGRNGRVPGGPPGPESRARADGTRLFWDTESSVGDPPSEIAASPVLQEAVDRQVQLVIDDADVYPPFVLKQFYDEFPDSARLLATYLSRLPVSRGVTAIRDVLSRRRQPTVQHLQREMCTRVNLLPMLHQAVAQGVTVPCDLPTAEEGEGVAEEAEGE